MKRKQKAGPGRGFLRSGFFKVLLGLMLVAATAGGTVFVHFYNIYATIIDRRLSGEVFQDTAKIYATPYIVYVGQEITPQDIIVRLRRAGLEPRENTPSEDATYQFVSSDAGASIIISPESGADYRLDFSDATLHRIVEMLTSFQMENTPLPPEFVTSLFDDTRGKRRLLEWEQLPPHLTDAVIAAEDQRFYRHFGIDLIRGAGAAIANMRGQQRQGASTLTMQLAGSFFLNRQERTWNRKLPEIFMALILDQRLTKREIFEMYANEMYLGHRGSFAIYGFGEAAAAYFGKRVSDINLAEAATLVGILPAPNAYSPHRNMERAIERRNTVLDEMYQLDMINMTQLAEGKLAEIELAELTVDESDAPYMVDFIRNQLLSDFSEEQLINDGLRVYTTLDPDLQEAAFDAVAAGIAFADEQLEAMGRGVSSGRPPVQAALIVLDPHTGEIKAMVGGRDYSESQYNRITEAFRQPGSIFKPFVYTTAFESAFNPIPRPPDKEMKDGPEDGPEDGLLEATEDGPEERSGEELRDAFLEDGPDTEQTDEEERPILTQREYFRLRNTLRPRVGEEQADGLLTELDFDIERDRDEPGTIGGATIITPLTTVMDEPALFFYEEDKFYEPSNYKDVFYGMIPAREALQRSLNVPTVKIAEQVGYDRIAELAHRLGLNADIRPYPSIALGSFEVTPFEMAGAYTALANEGVRVEPRALRKVTDKDGRELESYGLESEEVLRPELAYLMTNLLENVINRGTGAGVRSRGFRLPAAGKTGTSRDGWFAGYTKDLLAIAWVGFDDNRELDLEGSRSALPIWTSFMLRADELYPVRENEETRFFGPPGIELLAIDGDTLSVATPYCENRFIQAFIYGTEPHSYCPIHSFTQRFFLSDAGSEPASTEHEPVTDFEQALELEQEAVTPATFAR